MALIFVDGMDSYSATADMAKKWSEVSASNVDFGSSLGRFGGGGARINSSTRRELGRAFPLAGAVATTDELFVSFSLYVEAFDATFGRTILAFFGPNGNDQCGLTLETTGALNFRRSESNTGTVLGSASAGTIQSGQWYRIEVRVVLRDGSNGLAEVKVNETQVINETSIDTKQTSTEPDGASLIYFGGWNNSNQGWILDDVVIHSSAGSAPTGFLDDLRIQTLRPDAAGDSSDSTATGAPSRHEAVDDAGADDGDTSYVSMATAGNEDLYGCGDLTGSPSSVIAVVVNNMCRADGTTPRQIRSKVKTGVTEGNGATLDVPLGSNYATLQGYFPTDPDTAAAWTASGVNGMQIGQEVVS